jgi:hypothetical protein
MPWLHAAAAFLAGLVLYAVLQQSLVYMFLLGPSGIVAVVGASVIAFAAFGGLGRAMMRRRVGWWLGLTAFPWLASGAAVFLLAQTGHGWDPTVAWPYAAAGLVPATIALLAHPGPPRAPAVVCVAAAIAVGIQVKTQSDVIAAQQRLGSTLRPEVTSVAGYVPYAETRRESPGTDSQALSWGYITARVSTNGYPVQFVLTTDAKRVPACGPPLDTHQSPPEPQTTCTKTATGWLRTSASAHELTRVVDGKLVRVTGPLSTPTAVLRAGARQRQTHGRPLLPASPLRRERPIHSGVGRTSLAVLHTADAR